MNCCATQIAQDINEHTPSGFANSPEELDFKNTSEVLEDGTLKSELIIPNMHCAGCISKIEKSLGALPYVINVRANLSLRRVNIIWNAKLGAGVEFSKKLHEIGFDSFLSQEEDEASKQLANESKKLLLALAVSGFAAANIMLLSVSVWSGAEAETAKLFHLISGLIAVPAVAIGGRPFFTSALKALFAKRLNMDVPISLAVLLALGMGLYETFTEGQEAYFDACVMLLFFLLIGRYLDHLMRLKARNSVESLSIITSKGGILLNADGSTNYIALNDIKVGQSLRVYPGERFPVDGKIVSGVSDLDRSLVTGEGLSVASNLGDSVEAGVLNLTGALDIEATSNAKTSFTAEIKNMISAAENGRSRYVRIAERAASIYAPAVHLLALIAFVFWMINTNGDWKSSLYIAIAVLIITCPCALGLAVPVVHVIGASRLLKEGIIMRDGSAFERMSEINNIIFDKTGTLTTGALMLQNAELPNKRSSKMIAALSSQSSHPIASSLKKQFSKISKAKLENIHELAGYGIEAKCDGKVVRLGRPNWVFEISNRKLKLAPNTNVAFCEAGKTISQFSLVDTLRPDAKKTVEHFKSKQIKPAILSGDVDASVTQIAKQLNVDNFSSQMLPVDKINFLKSLQVSGSKTLMVGDGLNDAPALASAHVSMAPASASEVGRLASDFVFTRPSLMAIPFTWSVAVATKHLIQQNFAIAIIYNCIAVPLAMFGYVTPLIAAIAMSSSSILVVANSLRLNFKKFNASQFKSIASPNIQATPKAVTT